MAWSSIHTSPIDGNRQRRVIDLLSVLWILNLTDLLFTLWAYRAMPFYELNPIARMLLHHGALGSLVLFKVLLTLIGSSIFWRVRFAVLTQRALWGVVIIYSGLIVHWVLLTHRVFALGAGA